MSKGLATDQPIRQRTSCNASSRAASVTNLYDGSATDTHRLPPRDDSKWAAR